MLWAGLAIRMGLERRMEERVLIYVMEHPFVAELEMVDGAMAFLCFRLVLVDLKYLQWESI